MNQSSNNLSVNKLMDLSNPSSAFPLKTVVVGFVDTPESRALLKDDDNNRVISILNSHGSIGPLLTYAFVENAGDDISDLTFTWMTDDNMIESYGEMFRGYSAANLSARFPAKVYLNAQNWSSLRSHQQKWRETYPDNALDMYRRYVVSHEVGHVMGLEHSVSKSNDCDIMEQQTFDPKRDCRVSPVIQPDTARKLIVRRSSHPLTRQ